jgi:hypothetical protein
LSAADVTGQWNRDLDVVVFAGCSVLDINDYNDNFLDTYPTPGQAWAETGPQFLLGYKNSAPFDSQGSDTIIAYWLAYRGGALPVKLARGGTPTRGITDETRARLKQALTMDTGIELCFLVSPLTPGSLCRALIGRSTTYPTYFMKNKQDFVLIGLAFIVVGCVFSAIAVPPTAQHLITEALSGGRSSRGMFSTNAFTKATEVITHFPNSKEAATARLIRASHLAESLSPQDIVTASNDSVAVMNDPAATDWQRAVATYQHAAIERLRGNHDSALAVATNALSNLDFESLRNNSDPDFNVFLSALGASPAELRDGLCMLAAQELAEKGHRNQALALASEIENSQLRQSVTNRSAFKGP